MSLDGFVADRNDQVGPGTARLGNPRAIEGDRVTHLIYGIER
jgi:hypothetical protein